MDQEKEKNPIAEIFDEVFTLMQDLETRNTALLNYMQEQGGVTDEKLAPYLDQAAAAADVRWRAARARMEHLLAPKPKSATEAGSDEKVKGGSQPKGKESERGGTKEQGQEQKAKAESKDLGKELASAQPGEAKSGEAKDDKSKSTTGTIAGSENKSKQSEQSDAKENKDKAAAPAGAEAQASALGGDKKSDDQSSNGSRTPGTQSDDAKATNQNADAEKQQSQKVAK
jgi:hypothetical protein